MSVQTEAVWQAFRTPLWNYIARRVPNATDADDVLQDVFLKVHRNLPALENEERLAPWLYRVARNTLTDRYRRLDGTEFVEPSDDLTAREPEGPDPEQKIAACLKDMINDLPPAYRDALVLSEIEGLPQRVVAERLGLSLSGAKSRVQRGRRLLREALSACCHFEFDQRGKIMEYVPRATCCANVATNP
jgi:RNA polymerase sigma-70 factor (ECF subfamily)